MNILFWKSTDSWDNNISVSMRVNFDNFDLKKVEIILILVGWYLRRTLRVNKATIPNSFRRNLLKCNIKFQETWWDGAGRVHWTIINWYQYIYIGTVIKTTSNDPNYFSMYHVSIRQFHIGLGRDKYRKVLHEICYWKFCSYIFIKQHSKDCINFEGQSNTRQSWSIWISTYRRSSSCSEWNISRIWSISPQ